MAPVKKNTDTDVQLALLNERVKVLQSTQAEQSGEQATLEMRLQKALSALDSKLTDFAGSMAKLTMVVEADAQSKKNRATIIVAVLALLGSIATAAFALLGG